jgi:hypothetical protein
VAARSSAKQQRKCGDAPHPSPPLARFAPNDLRAINTNAAASNSFVSTTTASWASTLTASPRAQGHLLHHSNRVTNVARGREEKGNSRRDVVVNQPRRRQNGAQRAYRRRLFFARLNDEGRGAGRSAATAAV